MPVSDPAEEAPHVMGPISARGGLGRRVGDLEAGWSPGSRKWGYNATLEKGTWAGRDGYALESVLLSLDRRPDSRLRVKTLRDDLDQRVEDVGEMMGQ